MRMLLLFALIVGSVNGWADNTVSTLNFTAACGGSGTADDGAEWVVTSDGAESNFDSTCGIHYGTNKANVTYLQLTTSDISGNITQVVVNTRDAQERATVSVTVGGNAFTCSGSATATNTSADYTFTGNASGTIIVRVDRGSSLSKAIYVKSVVVTYSADTRTAVNVNSLTFDPTSIVVGGATAQATAGHNTPACTTATFTYESLDEDKATCTSAGVITAVAKGTARIKATMSIPNDDPNYRVGTATITEEITVSNPSHDAIFMANGVEHHRVSIEEGEAITFPASNPADLGGKKFMGWVAATIDEPTDVAPSFVTSATMSTSNITYYAVFATVASSTVTLTDNMTLTDTEVSGSSYTSWSNLSLTSDAVYAGNNAGGNDAIQLRSSTSSGSSVHSGIVSTTSGGKVKKITVVWNSNTADDRTLDIYGKNSAYSSVENLYGSSSSNQGTKLGNIVKGTSTVLTVTGDYTYVGLRSNSGAMYFDQISIDWEAGSTTYSAYCTTVTQPITVTDAKYATFASNNSVNFTGTGITAYTATDEETKVTLNEITSGKVPANTPVVLHKADADGTPVNVPVIASAEAVGSNDLAIVTTDGGMEGVANMFVLSKPAGKKVGFYAWKVGSTLNKGKVYLQGKASYESRSFLGFDDETTGIEAVDVNTESANVAREYYNLNGQRVANPSKGLYKKKKKKVIIK